MAILNPFCATLDAWTEGQTFLHLYPRFVPSTIDRRVGQHKRWISYYILTYECRPSLLISESKQRKNSCQLLLLFCGRFERSGVQAGCRVPRSVYQTRWPSYRFSGAGGVFISRWRCVPVVTRRKVWTPISNKSSKISFFNQTRWSRRPLLVISTVVNNGKFQNGRSLPDPGLLTKANVD